MINIFYTPIWEDDTLNFYNIYRKDKPMYSIKNIKDKSLIENLLYGEIIDLKDPLTYSLYVKGVILEKDKAFIIKKLKNFFDDLGPDIDLFFLSKVISRDFFRGKFNFINIDAEEIGLEHLLISNDDENAIFNHYIVGYSDSKMLESLEDKLTLHNNSTLFLCKIENGNILEFGPMYKIDKSFCFKCLAINMAKCCRIIKKQIFKGDIKGLINYEYMGALIDYYSCYITMLSSIHERELIINKDMLYHTELIAPMSLSCLCIEG